MPRDAAARGTRPSAPDGRRLGGLGGLDLNGETVAISLYDEGFQLVARSEGAGEGRLLTTQSAMKLYWRAL
jgi:hypothetical protein